MSHISWINRAIVIQCVNAFLILAFSIYAAVVAYPLWAIFQGGITFSYVLDIAEFVVPGLLLLVGWWNLRKGRFWGWLLAICSDAFVCFFMASLSLSAGWRDVDGIIFAAMSFSSAAASIFLLMPGVRERYRRVKPVPYI